MCGILIAMYGGVQRTNDAMVRRPMPKSRPGEATWGIAQRSGVEGLLPYRCTLSSPRMILIVYSVDNGLVSRRGSENPEASRRETGYGGRGERVRGCGKVEIWIWTGRGQRDSLTPEPKRAVPKSAQCPLHKYSLSMLGSRFSPADTIPSLPLRPTLVAAVQHSAQGIRLSFNHGHHHHH